LTMRQRRPLLFWSMGAFATATGVILGQLFAMYQGLPALERLEEYRPNVVTRILDRNGDVYHELYREKRFWVEYDTIPQHLKDAIVAVEDDQFFAHKGVRLSSILRALLTDIRQMSMAQGGSTITQQLAKVLFLTPEKKISRKIREALLAIELEKRYTKEEILELYCNQIFLGSGSYGVEAASRIYFGKSIQELTLAESAMLAGLPKAPNRYSPFKNPEAALRRRNIVLRRMLEEGKITEEEELAAEGALLRLAENGGGAQLAGHYVELVRVQLLKNFGSASLYQDGLQVTTTLDMRMQAAAEKAVAEGLAVINEQEKKAGVRHDGALAQAGLVAIEVSSGDVLAMVGGADFNTSEFNHATQALRQPGSAFKPFIYLAALEKGYHPASVVVDSPVSFPRTDSPGFWKPRNYSNKFYGPVTLRKALENSLNVSTVKLLHDIGEGPVINVARRLGVEAPLPADLSLALGSAEMTLMELTAAYATLANKGLYTSPSIIKSVVDSEGAILDTAPPRVTEAVRPEVAYVLSNMLKGVVENGTGQRAQIPGRHIAGKTGTTNDNRDAWFIGYTADIAVGVWVGFDDNRSLSSRQTGGRAAAPIWAAFMKEALRGIPSRDFPPPVAVVARLIDRETGLLANQWCQDSVTELFVAGMEPKESCMPATPNVMNGF